MQKLTEPTDVQNRISQGRENAREDQKHQFYSNRSSCYPKGRPQIWPSLRHPPDVFQIIPGLGRDHLVKQATQSEHS